jgi:hypothetical protein
MFRQGLGDCFLLTFDNKVHVLIDCGVIVGTKDPEPLMTRVVESIRAATKGKIDVLVVTHEHWDHVSGFKQARAKFEQIEFKEVWVAWTEQEGNPLADRLRAERRQKTVALKAAATRLAKSKDKGMRTLGAGLAEVLSFAGISLGETDGGDTGEAMAYARDRGKRDGATLKYFHPGEPAFALPGAKNVRIYVLGPPEDEKLLKRSDPSKTHSEVYLTLADALLAAADAGAVDPKMNEAAFPFAREYRITASGGRPAAQASAAMRRLFEQHYLAADESYRAIEEDWLASAGNLALQLDSDTNNTSLVLAFEFTDTGDVFLFPGDAQVGNWLSWDKYAWEIAGANGATKTVTATDLLTRTLFYKVGHHGSHNATLKERGLERMTRADLVAMIPVNQEMATKKTWKMPWPDLRDRLVEKCSSLIIQDEAETAKKPKRGKVTVDKGKNGEASLFVDYLV